MSQKTINAVLSIFDDLSVEFAGAVFISVLISRNIFEIMTKVILGVIFILNVFFIRNR